MSTLAGEVAIVTGAGDGIGRSEARPLAGPGAPVVVNAISTEVAPAAVAGIRTAGANHADGSAWKSGAELVDLELSEFGRLDVVVTDAGIVRRSAIVDVTESDVDAQMGVLFEGTYALLPHAANHWKREHAAGSRAHCTEVLTWSNGGISGGVLNFRAMEAGIAVLTLTTALELRSIGVTANAILPHAVTRMNAEAKSRRAAPHFEPDDPDPLNPQHVANVVGYLGGEQAAGLSGQVFEITGTYGTLPGGRVIENSK